MWLKLHLGESVQSDPLSETKESHGLCYAVLNMYGCIPFGFPKSHIKKFYSF